MENAQAQDLATRVNDALERIESASECELKAAATEALTSMLALYGEAFARIIGLLAVSGENRLIDSLAADELIAHLLVLHGRHPADLAQRVRNALDEVRPYLASHGGEVELLGIAEGVVQVRMRGSCGGCRSSESTLKGTIEEAVCRLAPEIVRVDAVGDAERDGGAETVFVPVSALAVRARTVEPARVP